MILSEQDIAEISLSAVTVKDAVADARAVEAALLAKLASAELPEPALPTHAKGPMFTADQLRQAYAQGAAAQLSAEPVGSVYNNHQGSWALLKVQAKDDTPLYTRRQA